MNGCVDVGVEGGVEMGEGIVVGDGVGIFLFVDIVFVVFVVNGVNLSFNVY